MTAEQILKEMDDALHQFGHYTFGDKGAREVMDLDAIVEALNALPVAEVIEILEAVYNQPQAGTERKDRAEQLVEELVCNMDGVDEARWDALMQSPILADSY